MKQKVELNRLFQKDQGTTASVAKGTVEPNYFFQKDQGKTAGAVKGTVEPNRLFQKDQGKTASAERILSPNPMRRPLPCLLIQSFFYGGGAKSIQSSNKFHIKKTTIKTLTLF